MKGNIESDGERKRKIVKILIVFLICKKKLSKVIKKCYLTIISFKIYLIESKVKEIKGNLVIKITPLVFPPLSFQIWDESFNIKNKSFPLLSFYLPSQKNLRIHYIFVSFTFFYFHSKIKEKIKMFVCFFFKKFHPNFWDERERNLYIFVCHQYPSLYRTIQFKRKKIINYETVLLCNLIYKIGPDFARL